MTCYLFKQFLFIYIWLVPGGLSQQNKHILILEGHGSHVTLQAIEQTYDMITLPSHTSHALEPLDVSCFRPFKFAFMKERNKNMFRNNHRKLDKVTLTCWVERTFN